jgi:hypothetical protein
MAIPIYDTLAYYATPPNSYIGTTIFLSYIVLALYATLRIVASQYTQYSRIFHTPTEDAKLIAARTARARHIKIYAFLASVSFATLSYHMLYFLITHYLRWTGDANRTLSAVSIEKLQTWMMESSLFQDFATELVDSVPNAVWMQLAILATWFWNVWMARKGTFPSRRCTNSRIRSDANKTVARTRNFDSKTLFPFILLSQILPISFTSTLFIIQLHLASPDIQQPTQSTSPPPPPHRKTIASPHLPNILLNATLLALPSLRMHPIFPSLILFSRFILLMPHTGLISLRESDIDKCVFVGAGFVVASQMMGDRVGVKYGSEVKALWQGGYAVKALGWDAVLGAVVWVCMAWGGGV